ncbi:DUF6221 family protein [Streptomyces sp. NPDC001156]
MDELVRWLGVQLDADERIARAAVGAPWEASVPNMIHLSAAAQRERPALRSLRYVASTERAEYQRHIAAHDPARVLHEIGAKRKVVNLHRAIRSPQPDGITNLDCSTCGGEETLSPSWPCPTIRLLASVYADRPGYREEWRP